MPSHKRPHELSDILLKNICFSVLFTVDSQLVTESKAAHTTVAAFVVKHSFFVEIKKLINPLTPFTY